MATLSPLILVADDDPHFLKIIGHHLRSFSYRVDCVEDKGQLLRHLDGGRPDLLLLDVRFGDHDGLEVLRQVLDRNQTLSVAMLTAFGSIESAISAIKVGAIDYLTKPVDLPRLRRIIDHAMSTAKAGLTRPTSTSCSRPILGDGPAVRELRSRIERVAASDATVLVLGESGTGKELVARAIHELSPRRDGPFVPLNVAALPRELVESTLFGHAKGAFTGADRMQVGCCEVADGGTLFLDEIGEMEIGLQAKLLRFLQEHSFQKVGLSKPTSVDVRVVTATNRDPREQIRRGLLREDLFYRLNVIPLVLPPLRNRRDDVPLLIEHFRVKFSERCRRPPVNFSEAAMEALVRYNWPGNIRELENLVERLTIMGTGFTIGLDEISELLGEEVSSGRLPRGDSPTFIGVESASLRPIDKVEFEAIVDALSRAEGNVREAARQLGLGQATIYRKIKKYNLTSCRAGARGITAPSEPDPGSIIDPPARFLPASR
jgi:two-component system, NtrC family, response regulator HydG